MSKQQVPAHQEAILQLSEHLPRVAHGRADLADRSDLVLNALLSNRDTVTRFCKSSSRNRVSLGRPAARYHDTGILLAVGRPELQGWLSDGIPRSAARTPEWDTRNRDGDDPGAYSDFEISSPTHADGQEWLVNPTEDLALDDIDRDTEPVWSTEERIAAPWTRILRDALDPEDNVVIEHGTTLAVLSAVRMHHNDGIGHVEFDPALGRDGRVSLPDIYDDVAVISIYVPEERLLCDVGTIERIAEQKGQFNPHNEFVTMPDVEPPSNGFLESD